MERLAVDRLGTRFKRITFRHDQGAQDEWVTNTKSLAARDQAFLLGGSCKLKSDGSQIVRLGEPIPNSRPEPAFSFSLL